MLTQTILCSLVITISVISDANAQNFCTTSSGTSGQCVLVEYCPALYALSQKPGLTENDRRILLAAICSNPGTPARVCCEDTRQPNNNPCRTPDNNPGTCISLRSCRSLYALLLQRPISPASYQLLQNSQCGIFDQKTPRVCCPNSQPVPTPTPPPQIREIDTGTGSIPQSPLLPTNQECGLEPTFSNIFGGNVTDIREYPWMVLLQYRNRAGDRTFACGGSIINKRYVMTAAHCVKGRVLVSVGTLVNVRVGEYDISTNPDCVINQGCNTGFTADVGVEETIAHPRWLEADPAQLNDIALVRMNRDLTFNEFVQPVCLPNKGLSGPTREDNLSVAGWGRVNTTHSSNIKMKLRIPSVPMQNCQERYERSVPGLRLSDALQFCAGGEGGKDSCNGDSGGPVVKLHVDQTSGNVNFLCMGVVSFGPDNCGLQGVPGIYTKVSAHINWILSTMRA